MSDEASPDDLVANALSALASPVRLRMLREIRQPRALREIEVHTTRSEVERTLSRQAVREHLDKLIAAGVVIVRDAERAYGPTQEFIVNHQAIYALGEEVRALARGRSLVEPAIDTVTAKSRERSAVEGPSLVLVRGLDEGTVFPLPSPAGERREWIIGRRRGVHIVLDFDPYISAENALVVWENGAHTIRDIAESTNGTSVNLQPLPRGGSHRIGHGDLVGVGGSLLLYWKDRRTRGSDRD